MAAPTILAAASTAWAAGPWVADVQEAMPFLGVASLWIALIVAVVAVMTVISARMRAGKKAARAIRNIAETLLDANTYRHLHDVTFVSRDATVHIDHVVVSPFGVFVIEIMGMRGMNMHGMNMHGMDMHGMNMRGEVSGKAFDPDWTLSRRGETVTFPNPLRPNYNRKLALNELLRLGEDKFFSIIAFTDDVTFRFAMPDNVTRGKGLAEAIRSRDAALIDEREVPDIVNRIRAAMVQAPKAPSPRSRTSGPAHLRYMNLLKFAAMAAALAGGGHVMHNTTQFPDIPSHWNPMTWFTDATPPSRADITRTEPGKHAKTPRSDAYGILTIRAGKDTHLTLSDPKNGSKVLELGIKAGESRDVEIRKGYYRAEIVQDGQLRTRTVSFIGASGTLEL